MIVKTEAIVLRSMKYRESSKILSLYTREYGKLSVIAKGCRGPKNRFGSSLEPLNYVEAVLYKKSNRDLQLLSQCDVIKPFHRIPEEMERLYVALTVVALLEKVAHPEEKNEPLFEVTLAALQSVHDATQNKVNVLYKYEIELLNLLGYMLEFHRCASCGRPLTEERPVGLALDKGGVVCRPCAQKTPTDGTLSGQALVLLQKFQRCKTVNEVGAYAVLPEYRNELRDTLQRYLRRHVEGVERMRTEKVFAAVL